MVDSLLLEVTLNCIFVFHYMFSAQVKQYFLLFLCCCILIEILLLVQAVNVHFVFNLLQNSGQITPIDVIIKLKEKYRFRVLLDESNSFGVLGGSGRGLTEHYRVPVCSKFVSFNW